MRRPTEAGILQHGATNMLVVPADQLLGDLESPGFAARIHGLLTARREARSRTLTATLGSFAGLSTGWLRSTSCSILTKSLRTTSPLKSLSSEVPRNDKP